MSQNPKVIGKIIYNVIPRDVNLNFEQYGKSGRVFDYGSNISMVEVDMAPDSGGGLSLATGATALYRTENTAYTYYKWGSDPKDWSLLYKTSGSGIEWGSGSGGPIPTTAGRLRDYQFGITSKVPESGIRFFNYADVPTSSVPLIINVESRLIGASIGANISSINNYQLIILINDVISEIIVLPAGDISNFSTNLDSTISAGDAVSLYIERDGAGGESEFSKVNVAIEIEEI